MRSPEGDGKDYGEIRLSKLLKTQDLIPDTYDITSISPVNILR
jgi:hypothetical protein